MKSSADKYRVLIIGYGNTLRGDDGLGCAAAENLRDRLTTAEVLIRHQLTPDLAEPLRHAELAVFIDASAVLPPGEISYSLLSASAGDTETLNHHASAQQLIALSQSLYGYAPEVHLFSMGGENWDYSESLSATIRSAMPLLIRQIERLIAEKESYARAIDSQCHS